MPDQPPLGVVLTGGRATRLRPLSLELPKALVPVLNRPLVAYALDRLAECGIAEVFVVVGPNDDRSGSVASEAAPAGMSIEIAIQAEPRGPGDALASVPNERLRGRHVAVIAADALLLGGDMCAQFDRWVSEPVDGWLPLAPTDRPQSMGIAQLEDHRITEFIEKPEHPNGNLASMAWWLLGPAAVDRVLDAPIINAKGELEISGTLGAMIEEGHPVGGAVFDGEWLDTGTLAALLATQRRLLDIRGETTLISPQADISSDCELGPNVVVGPGARLRNVRLRDALVAGGAIIADIDDAGIVVAPSGAIGRAE